MNNTHIHYYYIHANDQKKTCSRIHRRRNKKKHNQDFIRTSQLQHPSYHSYDNQEQINQSINQPFWFNTPILLTFTLSWPAQNKILCFIMDMYDSLKKKSIWEWLFGKKNLGNETHVNLFQILNGSLLTKDQKIKRSYMYHIYAQLLWVSHVRKESQTCSLVCKF
jgi:hypothetical protein